MSEHEKSVDTGSLGAFVRQARRARGWTQEELAGRINWTQERVSLLENGKYGLPSLPALIRLAESLDVPPAELLGTLGLHIAPSVAANISNKSASWSDIHDLLAGLSEWQMTFVDRVEQLREQVTSMEEQMVRVDELQSQLRHSRAALGSLTDQLRADTDRSD